MHNEENIRTMLLAHFNKYPVSRPQDLIKLIYQNEFAGGHMVSDEVESMNRLETERDSAKKNRPANVLYRELFDDIGNGYSRIHLSALPDGLNMSTVNRFFINTANAGTGNAERFKAKLEVLLACCRDGLIPFSPDEVNECIRKYGGEEALSIRHSDAYKAAYSPAYRVISKVYKRFFEIFRRIDILTGSNDRTIVAIDGRCGSGKSTLTELIGGIYDANIYHMDDFFLTARQRIKKRLKEHDANVDFERFEREVISGIKNKKPFQYNRYHCASQTFSFSDIVNPKPLNIIEGSYCMYPALTNNYNLKVFLDISQEKQKQRIILRNDEMLQQRFFNEWIPMENLYFNKYRIKEKCDVAINNSYDD